MSHEVNQLDNELSAVDELELQALEAELSACLAAQSDELELPSDVRGRLVAFAESMPAPLEAELSEADDAELEAELGAIFEASADEIDSPRLRRLADAAEALAEKDLYELFERTSTPLEGASQTRVAAKSKDAPGRARQAANRAWFSRSVLVTSAAVAALALYMAFGSGVGSSGYTENLTPQPHQASVIAPTPATQTALASAGPVQDTDDELTDVPDEESLMLSAMGIDDDSDWSLDPLDTPDNDEDLDALLAALDDLANEGG